MRYLAATITILMVLLSASSAQADWNKTWVCAQNDIWSLFHEPTVESLEIKLDCTVRSCDRKLIQLKQLQYANERGQSILQAGVYRREYENKLNQCNEDIKGLIKKIDRLKK